jgi:hypothetical protein
MGRRKEGAAAAKTRAKPLLDLAVAEPDGNDTISAPPPEARPLLPHGSNPCLTPQLPRVRMPPRAQPKLLRRRSSLATRGGATADGAAANRRPGGRMRGGVRHSSIRGLPAGDAWRGASAATHGERGAVEMGGTLEMGGRRSWERELRAVEVGGAVEPAELAWAGGACAPTALSPW